MCGGGGQVALLAEGVDRNLLVEDDDFAVCTSPSSRRAWIEIYRLHLNRCFPVVALLAEGVDRNRVRCGGCILWVQVALLAEGVDRNRFTAIPLTEPARSPSSRRAWIEISAWSYPGAAFGSPSSRRAWIEIPMRWKRRSRPSVALLAEGVDRNYPPARSSLSCRGSPSSRRAWIEITLELRRRFTTLSPSSRRAWIEIKYNGSMYKEFMVALLAEGVDRNTNEVCCWDYVDKSPSSRRAWIEICYTQ